MYVVAKTAIITSLEALTRYGFDIRQNSTVFLVYTSRALRRAAAAGLFCNAAAADKNASARRRRRRRFRDRRAAVKVSDPISFSGENLHAAYNF